MGTFRPVKAENLSEHNAQPGFCEVSDTARKIAETKIGGGRVVAVGTTVVKDALESFAMHYLGKSRSGCWTQDFSSTPSFNLVIDAAITNYHLPKSTLLMLVSAFGGYERIMEAYKEAVDLKYRFFSFENSMFIC